MSLPNIRNFPPEEKVFHSEEMTDDGTGKHYAHGNPLETINVMEYLTGEWIKNGLPAPVICDLQQLVKYCSSRLGRKGGKEELEKDLFKIENYAHRARTGKWLDEERSK